MILAGDSKMKISVPRGFVYFFIGALLFGVLTASFKVTCPIDKGTGVIAGAQSVEVVDIEGKLIDFKTFDTGCEEAFSEFTYAVKISLVNKTTTPGFGMVAVNFYHPATVGKDYANLQAAIREKAIDMELPEQEVVLLEEEVSTGGVILVFVGRPVATKLVFVEIPAEMTKTIEETIQFRGFGLEQITHTVSSKIEGETVCPFCRGEGKLYIIEWLKIKAGVY
jgi:hypothetical protein